MGSSANNAPELTSLERFFNRKLPPQKKTRTAAEPEQQSDRQEKNKFKLKALLKGNQAKVFKKSDENRINKQSSNIVEEEDKEIKAEVSQLNSLINELQAKVQIKAENSCITEQKSTSNEVIEKKKGLT